MSTFVLVHGAWHAAWCWERLVPELEAGGHQAITMDLPCDDSSATFSHYADVVVDALLGVPPDDIVLVGHSLAGLTVPLVAGRVPVRRLVYLCALPALPGLSFVEQLRTEPMLEVGYAAGLGEADDQGRRSWTDAALAQRYLYDDCEVEVTDAAIARLRPQALSPYRVPCPLDAYPDVPSTYVVCAGDRLVRPAWSRTFATERLGADLVEMPGGHSPFLSRPRDLARLLVDLA